MSARHVVWYLVNVPPLNGRLFPTGAWVKVLHTAVERGLVWVETAQGETLTVSTTTKIINSAVLPEGQTP